MKQPNERHVLSERMVRALRLSPVRHYELAWHVGCSPSMLSGWVTGALPVRPDDPRVLKLAALLHVPADEAVGPWHGAAANVGELAVREQCAS